MTAQLPTEAVVFDLDGTLLSTEALIVRVARKTMAKYGKELTDEALKASIGKPPLDAWQSAMDAVGLTDEHTTAAKAEGEAYPRGQPLASGITVEI